MTTSRAVELINKGNFEEAERILLDIAPTNSEFPIAMAHLGVLYSRQKAWARASEYFAKALNYPELSSLHSLMAKNIAQCRFLLHDFVGAVESYELAYTISRDPLLLPELERAKKRATLPTNEYIAQRYDHLAAGYEQANLLGDNEMPKYCAGLAAELLVNCASFSNILDVGCGTGQVGSHLRHALNPAGARMVGVDLSEKSLAIARDKNVYDDLTKDDALHFLTTLTPSTFDLVIAVDAVYFFPEAKEFLQNVAKCLKAGAYCIFNLPKVEGNEVKEVKYQEYLHYHHPKDKLLADGESAGLELREAREKELYISRSEGLIPALIYVFKKK